MQNKNKPVYQKHYRPYNELLKNKSRDLRNNSTAGEIKIWQEILKKKQTGYLFNWQKIIDNYIADFYCAELRLVIEIDGCSHNTIIEYDEKRTNRLHELNVQVFRYLEKDVLSDINCVRLDLLNRIKKRSQEIGAEIKVDVWGDG